MIKNYVKIAAGIRELGEAGKYEIIQGRVVSVDEDQLTMDIETDPGVVIFDVRLRAVIDGQYGIYVIPAMQSYCTIAKIEMGQDHVIIATSEIVKYILKIGEMSLIVSKDGFQFNDGTLKGLVKITELVQQLNAIEGKVNEIIAWSGTHLHAGSGAGTAPPILGTLTPTQISNLENTKIKQ